MADFDLSRRSLVSRAIVFSLAATVTAPVIATAAAPGWQFDQVMAEFHAIGTAITACPGEEEDRLDALVARQMQLLLVLEAMPAPDMRRMVAKLKALTTVYHQCDIDADRVARYAAEFDRLLAA